MAFIFKISQFVFILSGIFLVCCGGGGGGGGGSEFSPARSSVEIRPQVVEVGQEMKVILSISDVQSNLAVKVRMPEVFEYLTGSGRLDVQGAIQGVNPGANESEKVSDGSSGDGDDDGATPAPTATPTATPTPLPSGTPARGSGKLSYDRRYLVFYLNKDAFSSLAKGTLYFSLVAKNIEQKGFVEADIDVDDPEISNGSEFSIESPLFEAEDIVDVYVQN